MDTSVLMGVIVAAQEVAVIVGVGTMLDRASVDQVEVEVT